MSRGNFVVFGDIVLLNDKPVPEFSDSVNLKVEEYWKREVSVRGDGLYNGSVCAFIERDERIVHASFVEYKYFLAACRDASIRSELSFRPIGVSGLTWIGDSIVFARRSQNVSDYPGLIEPAPAGSIDFSMKSDDGSINYKQQLKVELQEELDLVESDIISEETFGLFYDSTLGCYDIVVEIKIRQFSQKELNLKLNKFEYSEVWVVENNKLNEFMNKYDSDLVPIVRPLIESI